MGLWESKYTDPQRDAVERAWIDRGIRPAARVVALANAGELEGLDPFDIPEATVRDIGRRARKRQAGEVRSTLALLPHRNAVDTLRIRLLAAADRELERLERRQRSGRDVPGDDLRQIARAVRELAALPGKDEPRPPAPGHRDPNRTGPDGRGQRTGAETRGGLAGAILRDVATTSPSSEPAPIGIGTTPAERPRPNNPGDNPSTSERNTTTQAEPDKTETENEAEHAEPGSSVRAEVDRSPSPSAAASWVAARGPAAPIG